MYVLVTKQGASQMVLVVKKITCQCWKYERLGFYPWVRNIPWRRKWQTHTSIHAWRLPWTEENPTDSRL